MTTAATRPVNTEKTSHSNRDENIIGHGLLPRFHAGCRCDWCVSRCWERSCLCEVCVDMRAKSPYVELRAALPAWWVTR